MSGRSSFGKAKGIILLFVKFLAFFPGFIKSLVYRASFFSEGTIGLLVRYAVNKSRCNKVGDACYFAAYTVLKNCSEISIGNYVSIHEFCYLDGSGGIAIGNNVSIAHGCSVITFDHGWEESDIPIKYNKVINNNVNIEDDVWVGAGVRILAGSYIESRTIVAAGAVVKGRLESGWVYGGVPARKLKKL
ncbi:acyltransferase [Alloalcanivorax xenomutans]|uniref:acyltransferase n=1 Tax=Alloalcanivorax xenomutans TaxID=1094342 RepID=UPI003BACEC06